MRAVQIRGTAKKFDPRWCTGGLQVIYSCIRRTHVYEIANETNLGGRQIKGHPLAGRSSRHRLSRGEELFFFLR